ncbi:DNA/RNA nuclease SfsA [Ferrimonas balearica]|uniref:DNA/RNA nuclease SfsA n=1 Tax=Ferrimonas balearica TaxID=44012 RepID=UPI001C96747C|nr:DNA/RNA nuclease SfsA [Ferrimonas balearica]MBY5980511.1 DNA/RNA nuclease SfsA [Ferrimonas balearica]
MEFSPPLYSATLIKRYKRFLADIQGDDGSEMTLHCPNTGAMTGCAEPGWRVWYSDSGNPKRKYPCTWELVQNDQGHWICVNTGRANGLAELGIRNGLLESLAADADIRREVRYGSENSRIDLLLSGNDLISCYIEVKSVTLLGDNGQGYFPDAVTARGQKHLRELMEMVQQGHRAVLLFVVPHTGIERVSPAQHIDPEYARLCREAVGAGVEFLALGCDIDANGIRPIRALPVDLLP